MVAADSPDTLTEAESGARSTERRVAAVVGAVTLGAMVSGSFVAARMGDRGIGALRDLIPLTVALCLLHALPIRVASHGEAEDISVQEAIAVPMLFLLPPLGVLLAFTVGMLFSNVINMKPAIKWAFNLSKEAGSVAAGLLVVEALDGGRHAWTTRSVPVALVAGAVTFIIGTGLVHTIIAVATGRIREGLARAVTLDIEVWITGTCSGVLLATAAVHGLGMLVFAAPILLALLAILRGDIKGREDRERLDVLLRTAIAAHASMSIGEVEHAITSATTSALRCRTARLDLEAPGLDERGAAVEAGGVLRWLVASGLPRVEFGPSEEHLLEAIAAIAAAALENAELLEHVLHQSLHDPLTGLPNRILLADRTDQAIASAARAQQRVALLFIDVDRFKRVNDSLGHAAGDELLCALGARITSQLRSGDTASRVGGDEFTVLLPLLDQPGAAEAAAERILEAIRQPIVADGRELFVTASIGLAVYPDDGVDYGSLLRAADVALYEAKARGRDTFMAAAATSDAMSSLTLESELHRALERGEMTLLYQPQVDAIDGSLVGVEALIRWEHPDFGTVAPDRFLPLAEDTGLISAIDAWVLRDACARAAGWQLAGLRPIRVAVNLSGRAIQSPELCDLVTATLVETGLASDLLEIELTEQVATHQSEEARRTLERLRAMGVLVALDDFGTGYSSLARLQSFPLDTIKIDKVFVHELDQPGGSASIVVNTIAIAHDLGFSVVAEGVETASQLELLRSHHCDVIQGYFTGRPQSAAAIEQLLRAEMSLSAAAGTRD